MTNRALALARLADSYLDHIRIAVEAQDRGAPFRDFIDNWAAFAAEHDHHRTASNRVIWFNNPDAVGRRAMLASLPFRSEGAQAVLDGALIDPGSYRAKRQAKDRSVRLIIDHAVPLTVIVAQLFQPGADLGRDGIRRHLQRHYHLGLLTLDDDSRLNALGLRSAMPEGWDGVDLHARYRSAGIAPAPGI